MAEIAGSDVVIKVVGDVSDISSKLDSVKEKMKSTGTPTVDPKYKKDYQDITIVLSELNKQLRDEIATKDKNAKATAKRIQDLNKEKEAIDKQASAMTKSRTAGQQLTSTLHKLGLIAVFTFLAEKAKEFAKESVKAYREEQQSETKLLAALNNRKEVQRRLIEQSVELMEATGVRKDVIQNAQSFLAVQGRTEEQINKTVEAALDLSIVTGDSLEGAVRKLDMTYEGQLGRLTRLDSSLKTLNKEQLANGEAVRILGEKYKGMALAMAQTDEGKLKKLSNAYEELKESVGKGMSGALAEGSVQLTKFLNLITEATKTTLSEELEDERSRVNALAIGLMDVTAPMESRNKLYSELKMIAPDVVKNIDLENLSTEQLTKNLAEYNKQMINKIAVTEAYEDSQEKAKEAANDVLDVEKLKQNILETTLYVEEELIKTGSKQAELAVTARKNYESGAITISQYALAVSKAATASKSMAFYNEVLETTDADLGIQIEALSKFNDDATKSSKESANALTKYQQISKRLGIDIGSVTTGQKAFENSQKDIIKTYNELTAAITALESKQKDLLVIGLDLDSTDKKRLEELRKQKEDIDRRLKSTGEQKTAYQLLTEQISKLNEKLTQQIMTGKGDIENTKEQIKKKTELKNHIDALNESFQEQLKLSGEINKLELKPQLLEIDLRELGKRPEDVELLGEFAPVVPIDNLTLAPGKGIYMSPEVQKQVDEVYSDIGKESALSFVESFQVAMAASGGNVYNSLIDVILGLKGDQEKIKKISDAIGSMFSSVMSMVNQGIEDNLSETISAIDDQLAKIDDQIKKKEEQVKTEEELAKEGKANTLATKKAELDALNALYAKGEADKEAANKKARQQQKELSTIQSAAALVSIIAQSYESGPIVGTILAAAGVVAFLAEMASVWSNAEKSTASFGSGTAEILGGKPHSQGGTSLGQYGTAEKGEFLGILRKNQTAKYGKSMITLFDGINQANENKKMTGLMGLMNMRDLSFNQKSEVELKEIPEIRGIYGELKKSNKTVYYENGKRIEKQGGITRTVYVN